MSVYSSRTKSSTPASILKSSTSLKSRISQIPETPSKVRFVLPHSKKVRNILKEYLKRNNSRDYQNLVCLIRDSELFGDDVTSLLKEATECISLLNQDLRLFVDAVLSISWVDKSDSVVAEYQSFVVNLISAHNYHAEFAIDQLVALFTPSSTDPEWPNGNPTPEDCKKCQHIHSLLSVLLTIVPMCKDLLKHSLINRFPYMKKSAHIHEYYLQNLLWVIHFQPTLRTDILHLIFSKLTILDVHAPKDVENDEDEQIFTMDDAKSTVTSICNPGQIAYTLDVCLDKVFNYFITECHDPTTKEVVFSKLKLVYHDMLLVFDKVILPTYNTHHVQFIMFVLCSLKPSITEAFFNYLWKKVCDPNVPCVIRSTAVNYMVSFMARATFMSLSMVKGTLQQMAEWIHSYIATQDGLEYVNSDVRVHNVFYTVCQSLFYVVAFRHKDLVTSKKNMVFLESLNMGKIVTSRLNPLRVCQPVVVQNFAAVTRNYQLAYCYSIIEHNSRNSLPTIYKDEKGTIITSTGLLEAFYPFDPFVLIRASAKVHPHYRNYDEVSLETWDEDRPTEMDTDDFLEHEMSVTSKSQRFSYGSSPGFKFKLDKS